MAQIVFNKISRELIVAAERSIAIFELETHKVKQTIQVPDNLFELISDSKDAHADAEDDEILTDNGDKMKNLQLGKISIQNVALSPDGKQFAVSTSGVKTLILYGHNKSEYELLSIRRASRAASVITFSPSSESIVLCDKSGDCFEYDCKNPNSSGKWILGHLSSIYDIKFSADGNFILTADRDEKVRITNYPKSFEIENYCLGHKEYICSIELLEHNPDILVTLSGDKTIRVWNWKEGLQLASIYIAAPGIKMACKPLGNSKYELAVLVFQPNECLYIYKLELKDDNKVEIKEEKSICLQAQIVTNVIYVEDFLIASIFNNNKVEVELLQSNSNKIDSEKFKNLKSSIESEFSSQSLSEPDDITGWFKKKFDNVSEYLERKRQRIEDKNIKKKRC